MNLLDRPRPDFPLAGNRTDQLFGTTPLHRFIGHCHESISKNNDGAVANYIPELTKADPRHFGISFVTIDGFSYEVGDSAVPFTIQSISKAFVFALALETLRSDQVENVVGVEPSGEAFNSIRLRDDNRPFNPMVNAGAIVCSALIYEAKGSRAFEFILDALSRFAGRTLLVDDAVFNSERATGDHNRAIAYLLRNHAIIKADIENVLDVYFRQCSVLVTARDLAIMAATIANGGVNPISKERVINPLTVARTLSVMMSSGMYDYAGEWIYRVGIPAKSGVGGGILAVLPSQLGIATYSPLLDEHGNSVRGLKVCEALSSHFDLHVLNRVGDVQTCIAAEYDIGKISSRRNRQPNERQILDGHHTSCHVFELTGALFFGTVEYISRQLAKKSSQCQFLILDFRRVATLTTAGSRLLADCLRELTAGDTIAILCGTEQAARIGPDIDKLVANLSKVRRFSSLDEAIEWAEDQIIYRHGGYTQLQEPTDLAQQTLLTGLTSLELESLRALMEPKMFRAGTRLIAAGEAAASLLFLQSGMVSVKLPNGVRLATLSAGMVVGEMALLEERRSADVWSDTPVQCLELPLDRYVRFRDKNPQIDARIMRNLAILLAKRLIVANDKIEMLTSH
jgi:glutaminase